MTAPGPISDDEYGALLASFSQSAFRLETRDHYAISEERADYEAFLAGTPRPPDQAPWWRQYLDRVAAQARQGLTRSRVRVLADRPTDYQRWLLWADPWYAEAGEAIGYLTRPKAHEIGLPDADWWLLDGEYAIVLVFDQAGRIEGRTLVTESALITRYRLWRDLAVRFSVPAAQIAAA
jgi:hypothetical protein